MPFAKAGLGVGHDSSKDGAPAKQANVSFSTKEARKHLLQDFEIKNSNFTSDRLILLLCEQGTGPVHCTVMRHFPESRFRII